jgi:hypothetical protein
LVCPLKSRHIEQSSEIPNPIIDPWGDNPMYIDDILTLIFKLSY